MNINEVYKIVSYLVDKYQGTYLSPDDFNMVINMAQRQYLNYMTEDGSGHRGLQQGRKMGTLITTPVVESLSKFLVETNLPVTSQIATQPADLYTTVSVRTTDNLKIVKRVTEDKLASILSDPIDAPTDAYPIYVEMGDTYKVYPSTLGTIKVSYIKTPADMKWAYTGNLVYDAGNSVQPEWNVKDMEDIIYRAIGIIGINLKDNELKMAAQIVKQQGE